MPSDKNIALARSLGVPEKDIVDDRPSRVEVVVTLRNGTRWVIDAFECEDGRLGLTLEDGKRVIDVIERTDGTGFVTG